MEVPHKIQSKKEDKTKDPPYQESVNGLRSQLDAYEKEKNILLALSNDITKVREKDDLINLFSSGLKGFFYFTHAVISLIDKKSQTYYPFLINPEAVPIIHQQALPSFFRMRFPMTDQFINQIVNVEQPITFFLEDIIEKPDTPPFIKINYECGIREAMMTRLMSKMEMIGYIIIYSDRPDSFSAEFKRVLHGIAPHLSNAVSNIIINDEIKYKELVTETLLSLSNDMVTVRDRSDLLNVINFGLKKLIYFTHCIMTVLNENGETYQVFLTDPDSRAKRFPEYADMITLPNPVQDGIYDVATRSYKPVIFNRTSVDLQKAPLWFKLNYEAGAREMMIKSLPGGVTHKHSIILFSDRLNNFDEEAINIIERISSQLATAAINILANEEIANREEEKSILLSLSDEIASLRNRNDLFKVVNDRIKKLFSIEQMGIAKINEDRETHSAFMIDMGDAVSHRNDFTDVTSIRYSIYDKAFAAVIHSDDPVVLDVAELANEDEVPEYVTFWKAVGFRKLLCLALKVGGDPVGTIFFNIPAEKFIAVKTNLLKAVCAQLAVAVSNILANEQVLAYKQMLEVENDHLKEQIKIIYNFSDIIGNGPEMQKVYRMMSLVADSNSTVLLLGETGTGKELIARAIHNSSPRKNKLMVKVNCAALPANLIESELFGHERGSFTGAIERRIGKFELANNSTLFLDEIGEMPLEMQVKLLRVLQEREFERVGGKSPIKVDVRIIAATNRNLDDEVDAGRFRSDLYYRLNVFPIILPPLRNRMEDIATLSDFFLARHSKNTGRKVTSISKKVIQELKTYSWPGNVRELEHLIERTILLTEGNTLNEIQLPGKRGIEKNESTGLNHKTLEQLERTYIIDILKRCSGKIAGSGSASELLEIPPTTLHSKMKKLLITKGDYFPQKS